MILVIMCAMSVDVCHAGRVMELFERAYDGAQTTCTYIDHNAAFRSYVYVGNVQCKQVVVLA